MKKLVLVPIFLLLTGCEITVLNPNSETGNDQAFLIVFSFALMMVVMIVVVILFVRFVWKYRETDENRDTIPVDVKGNKKLEITWTVLPVVLLTVLAVPTVAITYEQSPEKTVETKEEATHVDVTAQQFAWTFTYENGKETINELVIPEGETIIFHLKSKDVIHSFWIPELAGKTDVLPNKELIYEIKGAEIGTYAGKCAEFCGTQHAKMRFTTEVVSEESYNQWLKK